MSWEKVKLGDVADSCLGKMLDQVKNKGEYEPYLANLNVRWGYFELDNLSQMRFESGEQERYGLKYGDLVICEGGEPGRCAIWKDQIPNMKIQKALHRVRVHDCLDYRYLYYWFLYAGQTKALEQYFTGATIKHMPGDKLKSICIDFPPKEEQQRISEILWPIDSLIENNQKQIKLLEEAAQRLYKEWFVDLRFPGHETTHIVDGIPEGWHCVRITDLLEIKYGKDHKSLENGNIPAYGSGGIIRNVNKVIYSGESVLIPRKGSLNNIMLVNGDFWTIDTMFFTIPQCPNITKYVYLYLAGVDMYAMNIGAAVPSMTVKILDGMKLLCPSSEILEQFENKVSSCFSLINRRKEMNRDLGRARDLLLSKLMNKEIEV